MTADPIYLIILLPNWHKFAANTEDEKWMQGLARETDWVIVTADVNIGKNPREIRAWKEAGHTVFF